jgi:hypothetical protein
MKNMQAKISFILSVIILLVFETGLGLREMKKA